MKILFIYSTNRNSPDAFDPIHHSQGESLRNNGVEIEYFTVKEKGWKGYLKAIFELNRYLKNHPVDVVHGHYSYCAVIGGLACRGATVASLMGSDIKDRWWWIGAIKMFSKFKWRATVVKSSRMKREINIGRAVVIPNGVDLTRFRPMERAHACARVGFDPARKHIVFLADPRRPEKNVRLAARAVSLLDGGHAFDFHTVSGVSFTELPFYYSATDVLVLTSLWEGSPNAIKEAMACNCPIVATDVGDIRERIGATEGCFVTTFDPGDVAEKINRALTFGKRTHGREHVASVEINAIARRLIDLYRTVLPPGRDRRPELRGQVCTRCILDTSITEIEFDEQGVCNYCRLYDDLDREFSLDAAGRQRLRTLISAIRDAGKGKPYDCIVGVSGGVDSSYTLHLAKKFGLRPLAVHLDNGWDTEISVSNIKNITSRLGVDLETIVLDWEEFKDLQISFLKASVPSVEEPTDLAVIGAMYQAATTYGIRHILYGLTFRTEGNMPLSWGYSDGRYIQGIHKRFGKRRLRSFPHLTLRYSLWYLFFKRIKLVRLLNYVDYNREEAKAFLQQELGWKDYGGHHYESLYTRFYYSHISPRKFNMDRRKIPLAARVRAGQLTREEALRQIAEPPYPPEKIEEDKDYIAKKLGMTITEFESLLAAPPKSFLDYPSYYRLFKALQYLIKQAAQLRMIPFTYHRKRFSL